MAARLVQKLCRVLTSTSQLIETLDPTRELSPDDEFETEYLLENITKTMKKLQRIANTYRKPTSVSSSTDPPDGASSVISDVPGVSHESKMASLSKRVDIAGFDEDKTAEETFDFNEDDLDDSLNNVYPVTEQQVRTLWYHTEGCSSSIVTSHSSLICVTPD